MLRNTHITLILITIVIFASSCDTNPEKSTDDENEFISGYLDVEMSLNHFPALNEEATVYMQSSIDQYYVDSLEALGVDSIKLYERVIIQEDDSLVSNAFNIYPVPDSANIIDSLFTDIHGTTNWEFTVKSIRTGEFSLGVNISTFPGYKAIEDSVISNMIGLVFGSSGIIICVEEDTAYDCSPW